MRHCAGCCIPPGAPLTPALCPPSTPSSTHWAVTSHMMPPSAPALSQSSTPLSQPPGCGTPSGTSPPLSPSPLPTFNPCGLLWPLWCVSVGALGCVQSTTSSSASYKPFCASSHGRYCSARARERHVANTLSILSNTYTKSAVNATGTSRRTGCDSSAGRNSRPGKSA
eukprot:357360-Chlamydomonas_euryale.AAC.2